MLEIPAELFFRNKKILETPLSENYPVELIEALVAEMIKEQDRRLVELFDRLFLAELASSADLLANDPR